MHSKRATSQKAKIATSESNTKNVNCTLIDTKSEEPRTEGEGKFTSLAEWRSHRACTGEGVRPLDAPHATDDTARRRKSGEFGATEVADVVADGREAAQGDRAELGRVLEWVDGFVCQPPLDAHVDQALELILLRRGCLGVEEVEHLLRVREILNLHVPLDGSPDAVDPVFGLDGQGGKVPR